MNNRTCKGARNTEKNPGTVEIVAYVSIDLPCHCDLWPSQDLLNKSPEFQDVVTWRFLVFVLEDHDVFPNFILRFLIVHGKVETIRGYPNQIVDLIPWGLDKGRLDERREGSAAYVPLYASPRSAFAALMALILKTLGWL